MLGQPHVMRDTQRRMLPAYPPAGVAALDDVNPAFAIALVAIVVAREQIPVIIKRQFLRIAQPAIDRLEMRTVRLATKHTSFVGEIERLPFPRLYIRATVAE